MPRRPPRQTQPSESRHEAEAERPRRRPTGDKSPGPLALMGSGVEFAGAVVLLTLGGWWLDKRWGTTPWLMLLGLTIGAVGGTYRLYLEGKRFFRD